LRICEMLRNLAQSNFEVSSFITLIEQSMFKKIFV